MLIYQMREHISGLPRIPPDGQACSFIWWVYHLCANTLVALGTQVLISFLSSWLYIVAEYSSTQYSLPSLTLHSSEEAKGMCVNCLFASSEEILTAETAKKKLP
jgi:hypothetical protein